MTWRDYWNSDSPIYVNERHKTVHYRRIAEDIAAHLEGSGGRVLDYASGEALSADIVARRVAHLYLSDGAEMVRDRLRSRFGGLGNVSVLAPEEMDLIEDGSLDLVVVSSLLQYLTRGDLVGLLGRFQVKLKPGGRLIIADVIPPGVGPLTDALALVRFGLSEGFAGAALAGLVRTAFSDYRKKRQELGLTVYAETELLDLLKGAGFAAERLQPNFGHNPARMAFVALRVS
jgi:SAM-dependent methyltransferase